MNRKVIGEMAALVDPKYSLEFDTSHACDKCHKALEKAGLPFTRKGNILHFTKLTYLDRARVICHHEGEIIMSTNESAKEDFKEPRKILTKNEGCKMNELIPVRKKIREVIESYLNKEKTLEEGVGPKQVTINSPGHRHHGKVATVFHRFPDGRVNAQVRTGRGKADHEISNYTLKPGEFNESVEDEGLDEAYETTYKSDSGATVRRVTGTYGKQMPDDDDDDDEFRPTKKTAKPVTKFHPRVKFTTTTKKGSNKLTVNEPHNIEVGNKITGPGVPAGTRVTDISDDRKTITTDNKASTSGSEPHRYATPGRKVGSTSGAQQRAAHGPANKKKDYGSLTTNHNVLSPTKSPYW